MHKLEDLTLSMIGAEGHNKNEHEGGGDENIIFFLHMVAGEIQDETGRSWMNPSIVHCVLW